MGINLGNIEAPSQPIGANNTTETKVDATPVQLPDGGITLDLAKNTMLDLTKKNPGLRNIKVGMGWDVATNGTDFDLDVSAFLLKANGKITSGSDVIFYNNMSAQGIKYNGDNRTGAGEGDDETIDIDLSAISPDVTRIAFCVTIDKAMERHQTFGMVNNSYVRLMDTAQGDKELCRFRLKDDASTETAVIFAELVKNGSDWDFKTIGEGKHGDLNTLASFYS